MRNTIHLCWFVCFGLHAEVKRYSIDPVHSQVVFFVEHAGFSHATGRILRPTGQLRFDPLDFPASSVALTLDADAIDFGDANWNKAMQGKNYFDAQHFPTIHFASTAIDKLDDQRGTLTGNLLLLGKAHPIRFEFRFNRLAPHPYTRRMTIGFSAQTTLSRKDLGMPAAANVIGDAVQLRMEIEASEIRAPRLPGKK